MILWIFLLLFLLPSPLAVSMPNFLVVWNVGQGSWATLFRQHQCWHFDMGGEYYPTQVKSLCKDKKNFLFLSHPDWDHINFIRATSAWARLCLVEAPRGKSTFRVRKVLAALKPCPPITSVQELKFSPSSSRSNDLSRVYLVKDWRILFPGDSTLQQERIWKNKLNSQSVHWLILGHHGSSTSTSQELLEKLKTIKTFIASARSDRFGHPHPKVVARVQLMRKPLLKTEDWGHLWIKIPD